MTFDTILARLHLRAVIPTLALLIKVDAEARQIAKTLNTAIRFQIRNGSSTTLLFQESGAEIDPERDDIRPLILRFPSERQLNKLFLKQGFPLVIPNWRLWKTANLFRLRKLFDRMETILRLDPKTLLSDRERLETHVQLAIGSLAPRAFVELATLEAESRTILAGHEGLIHLSVANTAIHSWLDCRADKSACGTGRPTGSPDLEIQFRDLETAYRSTRNELDPLAAASGGELRLHGDIPLGAAANAVLDRIGLYLNL